MSEPTRGLLDTSIVVDHDLIDPSLLPDESAISAVTLAELAAGPHATSDELERARRQDRLQWAATTWDPLPLNVEAARTYGRVYAAAKAAGRSSRTRFADLLIAATAAANGLPIYTRDPADFLGLDEIVNVIVVTARSSSAAAGSTEVPRPERPTEL
jgi:predicted nucleic acid-binding protein